MFVIESLPLNARDFRWKNLPFWLKALYAHKNQKIILKSISCPNLIYFCCMYIYSNGAQPAAMRPLIMKFSAVHIRCVTTGGQRGLNSPGAESLWGRRKVPTMSQVLSSIQCIWFRKISGSNMGASNLLLAPGAISSRYAHGPHAV